jgi:hypothetical protein
VRKIKIGFIKQAMSYTSTHYREEQHINQEFIQRLVRHLFTTVDSTHDKIAQQKTQGPHKAVPTDMNVAYGKQYRIDIPSDVV